MQPVIEATDRHSASSSENPLCPQVFRIPQWRQAGRPSPPDRNSLGNCGSNFAGVLLDTLSATPATVTARVPTVGRSTTTRPQRRWAVSLAAAVPHPPTDSAWSRLKCLSPHCAHSGRNKTSLQIPRHHQCEILRSSQEIGGVYFYQIWPRLRIFDTNDFDVVVDIRNPERVPKLMISG